MSDIPLDSEKAKKILAERAARFAIEKAELTATTQSTLLVFNIGKEQKYAVDFDAVERIIPAQSIRVVPGVNPLFSGIIYHNAEFWPVVNLRVLFDCKQLDIENNFILLYDAPYRYALAIGVVIGQMIYDKANDLAHFSNEEATKHAYLLGIYQSDTAVIDISTILNLLRSTQVTGNQLVRNENE